MSETPLSRELFAVTSSCAYMNHAAVGVLPQPTRTALHAFVDAHAAGGVAGTAPFEANMPAYREAVGRHIGAGGAEIAFLRNTGDGALALAGGLDWRPGDEVLLCDNEFPANVWPWLALRDRGVNVRFVNARRERLTPAVLRRHVTARTRVVAVSWVSFADGYRHDLAALGEVAHAAGALLCVDAIQGLGAFGLNVRACEIDALYCGGAKWMMALQGVSFLYVRENLIDRLRLAAPGWRSAANMWDFLNYEQPLVAGASRFEGGTPNFIGALSLARSCAVLGGPHAPSIARHVLALTDRLYEGLLACGAQIETLRGDGCSSGIVTFSVPGIDPVAIGKTLQSEGIVTTYRPTGVRVSPHGYNTFEEIDRLLDAVGRARKEQACFP